MKIFLDLGTYSNRFLVPENPRIPKISQFGAKIKKLKNLIFLIWGTPGRGSKNFFGTRDLRHSVSRARKPPSTKNQPIWSQNKNVEKIDFLTLGTPGRGSKKIFWNSGLAPIDFSCPKTPKYQKSANFEKIFFGDRAANGTPFKGGV